MSIYASQFDLSGRVAIVTGGYGGIGSAVCRSLSAHGATIVVAGKSSAKATAYAAELRRDGVIAHAIGFDAAVEAEVDAMVREAVGTFGRIDILVNTVGGQREQPALDVTSDAFADVWSMNVRSAMLQARAVARQMIAQGAPGKQVHIGSVRGQLALRGRGYAAYCAAKGGLTLLCKQLAAEWAPHRINVNLVSPTFVRTEQVARYLDDKPFYEALVSRIPLGRVAEPSDVAGAVTFLVSSAADFVTGHALYVDGGITATQ